MVGSTSGVLPSTPLLPFWLPMLIHTQTLIENMLSQELGPSAHSDSIVAALSSFASRPDWLRLKGIDEPLHQSSLSADFDEALFQQFFSTAPSTCARALAIFVCLASCW